MSTPTPPPSPSSIRTTPTSTTKSASNSKSSATLDAWNSLAAAATACRRTAIMDCAGSTPLCHSAGRFALLGQLALHREPFDALKMPAIVGEQGQAMSQSGTCNQEVEVGYLQSAPAESSPELAKALAGLRINSQD